MMVRLLRTSGVVALLLLLLPLGAAAQNTTSGTAAHLLIGQIPVYFFLSDTTTERWYDFQPRAGRSYCVEVTTADFETTQGNPAVSVYQADGTTQIAFDDDITSEPDANFQSRACWIHSTAGSSYIKVTQAAGTHYYHMRLVETSLWSSWFFIGGDYNGFLLMRNTTDQFFAVNVTWRTEAGVVVGTYAGSVGAHQAVVLNARNFVTNPTVHFNGTLEVAHAGSPGALMGQVTSLSGTTGLNFDSPLQGRPHW